jgi:DNA-binding MarR family transcriptional regulator
MLLSMSGMRLLDARLADRSLGMQAVRVLVAMATSCDFENRVRAGQKDLSSHLAMDQSDVSKAIRALIEVGFIERPETTRGYYRISPLLLWKGSAKTLKRALEERAAA